MQFSYLNQFFSKIEKIDLPGKKAQALLTPEFRKEFLESDMHFPNAKQAGVLILLYPDAKGDAHFVLILRKSYKGVHSNQIAFPGGKIEENDRDIIHTALRETEEEIGVEMHNVNVVRPLTPLFIPPSNFMVYPTLAYAKSTPNFIKEDTEVERIIEVKLSDFLHDIEIETKEISTSYAHKKLVLSFNIHDYVVWGATAMMLSEFKVLMNSILK
jgi:8-oxo-dGTP pyrophosphatase MutT (NUDIX family)